MSKIQQHLSREVKCPTCGVGKGRFCEVPTSRRDRALGAPAMTSVRWLHHSRKAEQTA